jgi:uncharacterized protein with HEPN domain
MPDRRGADRDAAFIQDIVDSSRAIETYVRGKTLTDFAHDALLQDAVARRLFIIGEAAKSVSEELKRRVPSIDWKNIARLRDKLGHHYWTIEIEQVWQIVVRNVPSLRATLEPELPR